MRVYASVEPPQAFFRLCEEYPEECVATSGIETRLPASPQRLTELDEINSRVNRSISPERDQASALRMKSRQRPLLLRGARSISAASRAPIISRSTPAPPRSASKRLNGKEWSRCRSSLALL
jgi:transglutaminase-like cysteine proteinase BTLCP